MIVWPGLRRSVSAISRLFNSASFDAPLTHTAVPTRAASGTTATFTRATTATVRDNEGVLRTAIAGEARFEGARRVRNLLPSSEDLTSGWTATGGTLAAGSITESGATSVHYAQTTSMVIPATAIFIMQAEIKQSVGTRNIGIGTNSVGNAIFNPSTGVFVANDGVTLDHGTGTQTADGYWPVWVKVQATTSNKPIISLYSGTTQSYAGDGASQVLVRKLQLEDVTAQTTQTAGEYVSVGVASSPYYHGSMVDGVKCFATDINGAAIPSSTLLGYQAEGARTNLCLQSNAFTTTWVAVGTPAATQNVIGPDGGTTAWTLTDNDVGASEGIAQLGFTLTAATYTGSLFVKKTTGAQTGYPVIFIQDAVAGRAAICTVDTSNGVATVWTAYTGYIIQASVARCVSHNANYWRIELAFTATATADWRYYIYPAGTANATQATGILDVAATGSAVFYGAQVELGSFASSYIPTTTIAVARNADVLYYSSSNNLSTLSDYSLYCEAKLASTSPVFLGTLIGGNSAYQPLLTASLEANKFDAYSNSAGLGAATVAISDALKTSQTNKYATSKATTLTAAANGTVGISAALGAQGSDPTRIEIGSASGGSSGYANIRNVRIWQRALSSSELQAVTA